MQPCDVWSLTTPYPTGSPRDVSPSGTCYLCDVRCEQPDPFNVRAATIDHVIAYANGGQHTRANARTACLSCNSAKQATISPAA